MTPRIIARHAIVLIVILVVLSALAVWLGPGPWFIRLDLASRAALFPPSAIQLASQFFRPG